MKRKKPTLKAWMSSNHRGFIAKYFDFGCFIGISMDRPEFRIEVDGAEVEIPRYRNFIRVEVRSLERAKRGWRWLMAHKIRALRAHMRLQRVRAIDVARNPIRQGAQTK